MEFFFNGGVKTRKTAENTLKEPAAPTLGQGVCENSKNPVEKEKIGESSAKVCSAIANSGKHYLNRNKRRKSGGKKLPTFPYPPAFLAFYAPSRSGLPFFAENTEKSLPKGKRVENTSGRRKTPKFSQKYRFLAKIGDPSEKSPESMLKTRENDKSPSKPRKSLFYEVASGFVKFGDNVKK